MKETHKEERDQQMRSGLTLHANDVNSIPLADVGWREKGIDMIKDIS